MSFLSITPQLLSATATGVAKIGSGIVAADVAAAGATTNVLAAGAHEVSTATIATLFGADRQIPAGVPHRSAA
ncbi:PE family protein [Mycobacterium camsae]|uniref:PE family protein n=1 Tax=Mycobacterium gordonae TaxID=1778 RepID=UPI0019822346|nr:PE family protein [Mycobacterium gordonae]